MIGCFALALLVGSGPQAIQTADEIREKLERPVTMSTDIERLPVALDDLGSRVGVRIRCESKLNRAVVIVSVRNKPAKEVFDRLLQGIGAGSAIQGGTINVGLAVATPEEEAKLNAEYANVIRSYFKDQANNLGCDKPMDEKALDRAAVLALSSFDRDPQFNQIQVHPSVYAVANQTPLRRCTARLCGLIDPQLFVAASDLKTAFITMKELPREAQQKALQVFSQFRSEQEQWANAFASVRKRAEMTESYWLPPQITVGAEPLDKTEITGFRMTLRKDENSILVEFMSGSESMLESQEYMPMKRQQSIEQIGKPFDPSAAKFSVAVPEKAARLSKLLSYDNGAPKQIDREVLKAFAGPWKDDPLSFSVAGSAGAIAEKLDLNLVAYLGDQGFYSVLYQAQGVTDMKAADVLRTFQYSGLGNFRKDGDWLLLPCQYPERYLAQQMDRAALDKFLRRAYQPGCLTLDEYCAYRSEIGKQAFGIATTMADIVQPGFHTLNPFGGIVDLWSELSAGQKTQMANGGLAVGNLPPKLFNYVYNMSRAFGGNHRPGDPEGLFTDPPTKPDVRKARVYLQTSTSSGLLFKYGDNNDGTYRRWANYTFMDVAKNWRGPVNLNSVLDSLPSEYARPCRETTFQIVVAVPIKQFNAAHAVQYDVDVSTAPIAKGQLRPLIESILRHANG